MTLTKPQSLNSEITRLADIDPRLAQARITQVQTQAEAKSGPSKDEQSVKKATQKARTDAFDRARKTDKKQVDKVLNHLLPVLKKHPIATEVVADHLQKLVDLNKTTKLGSKERIDGLRALKFEAKGFENAFVNQDITPESVDPQLMTKLLEKWSAASTEDGKEVHALVNRLIKNDKRVDQMELGAAAAVFVGVGGHLSAGTTQNYFGDKRFTLGAAVAGYTGLGGAAMLSRYRATISNDKRSFLNSGGKGSGHSILVPGIMFWSKSGEDSVPGSKRVKATYGKLRPTHDRLAVGGALMLSEGRRAGFSMPVFPLRKAFSAARETLGFLYAESMLSEEALVTPAMNKETARAQELAASKKIVQAQSAALVLHAQAALEQAKREPRATYSEKDFPAAPKESYADVDLPEVPRGSFESEKENVRVLEEEILG